MKLQVNNNVDPSASGLICLDISGTLLGWPVVVDLGSSRFQEKKDI